MESRDAKVAELSFTILEDIIVLKDKIDSKDEILKIAKEAKKRAEAPGTNSDILIEAYKEMLKKLESLSLSEILEIKEILTD